jgi:membrane-bound ClpP family serine protease
MTDVSVTIAAIGALLMFVGAFAVETSLIVGGAAVAVIGGLLMFRKEGRP